MNKKIFIIYSIATISLFSLIKPIENIKEIEIKKETFKIDEDYLALIKNQNYKNENQVINYIFTNEVTPSIQELNELNEKFNK